MGAMTFGEHPFRGKPFGVDKEKSRALFDTYVEAGGNFFDTANVYGRGLSETYLGEFIQAERDRFVVASKYTITMREGDPNASGSHRKNMVQSIEKTLQRLKIDYLDLYWVHFWDWLTPPEELMRALDDLVRAGKVLYIGISDAPAWRVAQANVLAELRGWTSFIGLQIEYSLIQRTPERELLPMAAAMGLDILAWGALGGGVLTGKFKNAGADEGSQRKDTNQHHGRFTDPKCQDRGCGGEAGQAVQLFHGSNCSRMAAGPFPVRYSHHRSAHRGAVAGQSRRRQRDAGCRGPHRAGRG